MCHDSAQFGMADRRIPRASEEISVELPPSSDEIATGAAEDGGSLRYGGIADLFSEPRTRNPLPPSIGGTALTAWFAGRTLGCHRCRLAWEVTRHFDFNYIGTRAGLIREIKQV